MQSSRKPNKNSKRGKGNKGVNFAKPVMGDITNQSEVTTLEAWVTMNFSMASGGLYQSLASSSFNHFNQLAADYRFYEVLSHRIKVDWDNASGSSNLASFAFYPINTAIETAPTSTPTNNVQIDGLSGAVQIQPQGNNVGRWAKTGFKQQFSCAAAATNAPVMGNVYGYVSYKSSPTINVTAGVTVFLNVRFYGSRFNLVVSKIPIVVNADPILNDESVIEEDQTHDACSCISKKGR